METVTIHKKKIALVGIMAGIFIIGLGMGLYFGMHTGHGRGGYQRMGRNMQYQGSTMHITPPNSMRMMRQGTMQPAQGAPTDGVPFEVTATTTVQ